MYIVRGVSVDATAQDAVRARAQALADGQQRALRELLIRLTPESAHASLPQPSASEVENMVLGISISDERTSNVRYLATIDVRFIPEAITTLLQGTGVTYIDTPAPSLVVLPVWLADPEGFALLWTGENPWLEVWKTRPRGGMVPLELPLGDDEDQATINADLAVALEGHLLERVAARYGTGGALVVRAAQLNEQTLRLDGARTDKPGQLFTSTLALSPNEPLEATLRRAANEVSRWLEEDWKGEALAFSGPTNSLTLLVPIASLDDWQDVRRQMDTMPQIRDWTLQALTRSLAQVSLTFGGSPEQMNEGFGRLGRFLVQEGNHWVLTRPNTAPSLYPPSDDLPADAPLFEEEQGTITLQ